MEDNPTMSPDFEAVDLADHPERQPERHARLARVRQLTPDHAMLLIHLVAQDLLKTARLGQQAS